MYIEELNVQRCWYCICAFHSGGVAQMNNFLEKFFPAVYARKQLSVKIGSSHNIYCQYNNQALQAYVASISLAAAVSTLFASYFTRNYGRKTTLISAGVLSIIGVILKAAAQNLGMFFVGRIIIGFGLGLLMQVSDDFHILVSSESKQEHFLTNSLF
jgi:MFS family permease